MAIEKKHWFQLMTPQIELQYKPYKLHLSHTPIYVSLILEAKLIDDTFFQHQKPGCDIPVCRNYMTRIYTITRVQTVK